MKKTCLSKILLHFVTEYLQKGQLIYIEGKLQTRTYKDKDDVQHWKTEVVTNVITPLEWKTGEKKENGSNGNWYVYLDLSNRIH